ncbi:MAG: hypothetical protein IPJ90_17665 [Anaerolineaceae bacterium]|nr:hypothetical protein [Anaerolineaceae bacterium]
MKNESKPNNHLPALRVFGGSLAIIGLIFAAAWLVNRQETSRFLNGTLVEGTIERIHEGDPPIVVVSFVDGDGRSQTWNLENMTQSIRSSLNVGDKVVAVQMLDSPSRIRLLAQVENRPSDSGGLVATAVFLLPGLFLALQKRPYGSLENQQRMKTRQRHLVGGSLFLFTGFILLIGFYATINDPNFPWLVKLLFGAFCLLTGGFLSLNGLRALLQAWHSR